jgi:hypothetical protein
MTGALAIRFIKLRLAYFLVTRVTRPESHTLTPILMVKVQIAIAV